MLQFVLTDKAKRLFETQRYCFLGAIDDRITIGAEDKLPKLVKAYVGLFRDTCKKVPQWEMGGSCLGSASVCFGLEVASTDVIVQT
jgi:hypothetical protein